MSDDVLTEIELMCQSYAIQFTHKGNGHVQLRGHGCLVNYYPLSKKKTVFCNGKTTTNCLPYDAIRICKLNGKVGLKPKNKTIKKNAPYDGYGVQHSECLIKHPYSGEKPPWDYPTLIMCYPDLLRIRAKKLLEEADNMENPEYYKD